MRPLTQRQRDVLSFILSRLKDGYPPTIREIAQEFDIASPTGVVRHLEALERKGYIRRAPGARAIQILEAPHPGKKTDAEAEVAYLPILGKIAAGSPLLAEENIEGFQPVSKLVVRHPHAFLLRVKGDSMERDHILDGDLVIVDPQSTADNGDIVVALIGDEATVKRYYRRKGHVQLRPANPKYKSLTFKEGIQIQGKVVGVQRKL